MNTRTNEENILKIISKSSQYLRRQENGGRFFVDIDYSRYNSSPIQTNGNKVRVRNFRAFNPEKKSVISKSVYVVVSTKNAGCPDGDWHHRAD